MDLLKLKYFYTIAELQNMSHAAQILHISQPALSKALSTLETELGTTLFFRNKKKLYLTPAGEIVQKRAEKIFSTVDDLMKELTEFTNGEQSELKIISTLPYTFKKILTNFLMEFPHARVKQSNLNSKNLEKFIHKGEFDLCISTLESFDDSLEWTFLMEEDIFLSVPHNHELAQLDEIDIKQVKLEQLVGLSPNFEFRQVMDKICNEQQIEVNYQIEFEEATSILQLARNGIGISFSPETAIIDNKEMKHLKIINQGFSRKIGLLTHKEYYQSFLTKEFIRHCIQFFESEYKNQPL